MDSFHAASIHLVFGEYDAAEAAAHIARQIFSLGSQPIYHAKATELIAVTMLLKGHTVPPQVEGTDVETPAEALHTMNEVCVCVCESV